MKRENIWAVLPVAGRSRRMHRFKPLLPLGEKTILEQTVSRFHEAGIEKIIAVTGHRREDLAPILKRLQVLEVFNPGYAVNDMFCSVQLGIRAMFEKENAAAVLISPGDSPLIHPDTITQVIDSWEKSEVPAVIPCYGGQDGHPPLLSETAAKELLRYEGDCGLRGFIAGFADIRRIEAADAGMLLDADTPEDYERLQEWYQSEVKGAGRV